MKKTVIYGLLFILLNGFVSSVSARQPKAIVPAGSYGIEVLPHGVQPGDTLWLKAYYGDRTLPVDTAIVGRSGKAIFAGNKLLLPGMYCITTVDAPQQLDFFISDHAPQHFRVNYALVGGLASAYFDGSPENTAFADFHRLIVDRRREFTRLPAKKNDEDDELLTGQQDERKLLLQEVVQVRDSLEDAYKKSVFAVFLSALQDPTPPPYHFALPQGKHRDSLEQNYYYTYLKKHYFDAYNFSSPYILRMPVYAHEVDRYFEEFLLPEENEFKEGIDDLLKKAAVNDEIYKYTVIRLYELFRKLDDLLPEEVLIYLGEQYIVQRPDIWKDSVYIAQVKTSLALMKRNQVGAVATDLLLQNIYGRTQSLHAVKVPYTIVYFYSPTCASCAQVTPLLHSLWRLYAAKGVQVYAVYVDHNKEEWKRYVNINNLLKWINVRDPDTLGTAIYNAYDIPALPVIYLLDNNKKIIAKDLRIDELEMWLKALDAR